MLDLDLEISQHPSFDAAAPAAIYADRAAYEWADARIEHAFQRALRAESELQTIVLDGTGTKLGRCIQRMRDAQRLGWWTHLLSCKVSLETAVARNLQRRRQVPLSVLVAYQARLDAAVAAESQVADEYEEVELDAGGVCSPLPVQRAGGGGAADAAVGEGAKTGGG